MSEEESYLSSEDSGWIWVVRHASDTGQCTNTCERAYTELVLFMAEEVAKLLLLGWMAIKISRSNFRIC